MGMIELSDLLRGLNKPSSSLEFTDTVCSTQERLTSMAAVSIYGIENDHNELQDRAESLIHVLAKIDDAINPSEAHL